MDFYIYVVLQNLFKSFSRSYSIAKSGHGPYSEQQFEDNS